MDGRLKKTRTILGILILIVSPLFVWISVSNSNDTVVFASLSRMIWYSGDALGIFIAMLLLMVPMLIAFFLTTSLSGISRAGATICRVMMVIAYVVLYIGAMELKPSNGHQMTTENIWHGILSFGGILLICISLCTFLFLNRKQNKANSLLLAGMMCFVVISSIFSVLNVFDDKSYVLASGASELYILTMLGIVCYLSFYLTSSDAHGTIRFRKPPTKLETERLLMRPFLVADAEDVYEYLREPAVNCFADMKLNGVSDAKKEMRKRSVETEFHLAIVLKKTGKVIGEICAFPELEKDTFSPYWMLNQAYIGQGYAHEAANAFFDYLFEKQGARRIYAYTEDYNIASQHLCERLGMRKEGMFTEFISFVRNPDGTPRYENTWQYAILEKEWKELKKAHQ